MKNLSFLFRCVCSIALVVVFISCENGDKVRKKGASRLSTYLKPQKLLSKIYALTGKKDTVFYCHQLPADLNADGKVETIACYEGSKSVRPEVFVYFPKTDSLLILPLNATAGIVPKVECISLLERRKDQLLVRYVSLDSVYHYKTVVFDFTGNVPRKIVEVETLRMDSAGVYSSAITMEWRKDRNGFMYLALFEAALDTAHLSGLYFDEPALLKKSVVPYAELRYNAQLGHYQ